MAVPDTTTFNLQDVVNEVNPTTNDLVDCFADADVDYFNSAYEGSKNNLLNFRDYGSHNVPKILYSTPDHYEWASTEAGSSQLRIFHLTITPDIRFMVVRSGDSGEFTLSSDQSNNTIIIYPNDFNNSGRDYEMIANVSALGYPSEQIIVTQYSFQ